MTETQAQGARAQERVEIVRNVYASFARGDLETVMAAMDPEIVWVEPEGVGHAGTYRGHDELRRMFPENTEWESFRVMPMEFYGDGDTVIVLGQYGGKNRNTGKEMKASFAHKYKFKGPKVSYFEAVIDTGQIQKAMTPGS